MTTPARARREGLEILVLDDEAVVRESIEECFASSEHDVTATGDVDEAKEFARNGVYDLLLIDLRLDGQSGIDLISDFLRISPWLKIVLITGHGTIESAVKAIQEGAYDFITKPLRPIELRAVAERVAEQRRLEQRIRSLEAQVTRRGPPPMLSSDSPALRRVLSEARSAAESDVNVLLTGESGTGKGVLARAIHGWSKRAEEAFVVVHCPALSSELLRSELFGHVRGAFTGAVKTESGKIAVAEGGTLFLDEIGDLDPGIQAKLLRFLQDREYERLGDTQTRSADVRVIAATNADLEAELRAGNFREDLFYRLNVVNLELPPLRERPEDVEALAEHFLLHYSARYNRPLEFTDEARKLLREHDWPGNARELDNAIERAVVLSRSDVVGAEEFSVATGRSGPLPGLDDGGLVTLEEMEKRYIRHVLDRTPTIEDASEVLGVSPTTLWRRRRKYDL
ncbi:MAG TPA: sigma-54 dependent transcriptional regulator [Gemmatimonadota bacterium]|nr:sigma-54 dependent transcriptional regulator [Gemmatimonadota bacterium]